MSLRAVHEHAIADSVLDYSDRETALYALSLGLGDTPDAATLPFVYEGAPGGLQALPAMAIVLTDPGFWMKDTALDQPRLVHLAERLDLLRPVPARARLVRHARVVHVADKGAARGALLVTESRLCDDDGAEIARVRQTVLARGDGGTGEVYGPPPPRDDAGVPDRAPDAVIERPTLPQQALLYRWNGDMNPLHADPAVARAAGFERPILHGLCTLGVASLAVMEAFGGWDADCITAMEARFSAPVYPGETLRCAMWRVGARVILRASLPGRGLHALDPAVFTLRE